MNWNEAVEILNAIYDSVANADNFVEDFSYKDCVSWIDKVIFNDPATIIIWKNGEKTVVKANNEPYDKEKGLAMAMCKYFMGNKGNFNEFFKEYIDE